jgi:hypothetical protein
MWGVYGMKDCAAYCLGIFATLAAAESKQQDILRQDSNTWNMVFVAAVGSI